MLLERTIDRVMGGVRQCHRDLIEHGAKVILDNLVIANKPFAPSAPPSARVPTAEALSPDALTSSTSSSVVSSSSNASQAPPESSTPCSASHSSSPSSPSTSQPDVVALDLFASKPRESFVDTLLLFRYLTVSGLSERDFTFAYVIYGKQHASKTKTGEKEHHPSSPAHLVFWHRSEHVLELQADTGFTAAGVTNAVARDIALNSARALLLEYVEQSLKKEESSDDDAYTPIGADDPAVIQFVARFRANLTALIDEANSAPATFSVSHASIPREVEGQLHRKAALRHRRRVEYQEYLRLLKEYEDGPHARKSEAAGGGDGAVPSPAPAEDVTPDKPVLRHDNEPMSPEALASSPPLVLRPMSDLYRVFTDAEIMVVFSKVILSRDDCILCPGFEVWFEKKRTARTELGAVRHEYGVKTGDPYC